MGPAYLHRAWVCLDSLSNQLGGAMAGKCLFRVKSRRKRAFSAESALRGEAEAIDRKADIGARRSAFWPTAEVLVACCHFRTLSNRRLHRAITHRSNPVLSDSASGAIAVEIPSNLRTALHFEQHQIRAEQHRYPQQDASRRRDGQLRADGRLDDAGRALRGPNGQPIATSQLARTSHHG